MALDRPVELPVPGGHLRGDLAVPDDSPSVVVFAHGSGSSRHSPRNRRVAEQLRQAGLGALLVDLLTEDEELVDERTAHLRFDIGLLAGRLVEAVHWLDGADPGHWHVGYFGASTGAAAAPVAAARQGDRIGAVVSRGGRPDLAGEALGTVTAPTLLVVGGRDELGLDLNRQAMTQLRAAHRLEVVDGATHLFEEPGTLDQVAALAADWFTAHLGASPTDGWSRP